MFHNVGRRIMIWWGRSQLLEWYATRQYQKQRRKYQNMEPSDD